MDDYADAFYNQPIVYTIEEDESKKSVAAPAKTNAKVALVSKKLNRYNVFNLFGEICICTASKESHKDKDGAKSRTYYYEYHYHSLDSQQEKLILFTKTEKTETVFLGRNKVKTDIPPDIKIDRYGNYEKTEVLKTSYELYSDTKDEGYGKAGRHGYLAYSKRIPETEFTIYESKCCTVKHIGGNVFEDVVSGIKYPLHDSYPTNKGGFSDNYYCNAVVFENKVYPVHNLRFENSVLAQYKDGKFIFFDGQLPSKYYSYSLPLEKHIKILRLNGRDTVYAPKEGEYYELSYTYHHNYYFKELLFMKPLKLTPVYGVLQAAKAANEYSCRGETKRDIDFRDSVGNPYHVLPYTIPGDTYDKITDKVCFARILAKERDSSGKSYAIVDKLYYGSEIEMTSISSNSMGHILKQKGGSLTLSIPDRCVHFTIKEGYKVLCTVCRNQDFASVNRESALIYVNKVLKETKKEVTLPSVNKLTNLKKGDILHNYETFIATYNVTIIDDCGMTNVLIDGIDLKEQKYTIEDLSFEDHVKVYNRKLLSIDLLPCEIKGDLLIITTKNKELVYLDEEMTHKVFDSKTPPKKVYAYHYGNIYYFACGERDETCV